MVIIPDQLKKLLQSLQQVPYLASKNLYRVANYFLEQGDDKAADFCKSLLDASQNIVRCDQCFAWQSKDSSCGICFSSKRDDKLICVVEQWPDLLAIERTSGYKGHYHVLGGVISPLNGIGPGELTIKALAKRIELKKTEEIVLALSQTPEGEATIAYIMDKLKNNKVKVSVLAQGMPVGSSLEYMDRVTLTKALTDRKQLT